MMRKSHSYAIVGIVSCLGLLLGPPSSAHPTGNFSINHYARLTVGTDTLSVRYLLDFAELATVEKIDRNGDSRISPQEREIYLETNAEKLRDGLTLTINEEPTTLEIISKSLTPRPGAGGLDTMLLTLDLTAPLPKAQAGATYRITYKDGNFVDRTGWREIIAVANSGEKLTDSTAASVDLSKELTVYPTDLSVVTPQQSEAAFTVTLGTEGTPVAGAQSTPPTTNSRAPQDAFTQAIAAKELTPGVILVSLCLAFVFGAFHTLSPGHGKAMVAAYLVGARGTARHAAFLGGVVTITHTIGVFALGLVTLAAAQYVVPEKLYPVLSALSGVSIVVIGALLFRQRLAAAMNPHAHAHHHHDHDHVHHDHTHEDGHEHHHDHDHDHDHSHSHDHAHHHEHSHDLGWHDHGDGHYHSHLPPDDAPISFKSLLALGITGGAMPCPSALVVMLGAIALHRVAFGLALITSFSLGLAAALTTIGLLVVYARDFLERMPFSGKLTTRLPVVSAAIVTCIGLALVVRAVSGSGF